MQSKVVEFSSMKEDFPTLYKATFAEEFNGITPMDSDLFCFTYLDVTPLAWALMRKTTPTVGYLSWGGVLPEYRGESEVHLNHLFNICIEQGLKTLNLLTVRDNTRMQIVALKNGFIIDGVYAGTQGKMEIMFTRNEVKV